MSPLCTCNKSLAPSSQSSPIGVGRLLLGLPKAIHFQGWTSPAPPASPCRAGAPTHIILVALSELIPVYQCLSCTGGAKPERSAQMWCNECSAEEDSHCPRSAGKTQPICLLPTQMRCRNYCFGCLEMTISSCVLKEPVGDAQHHTSHVSALPKTSQKVSCTHPEEKQVPSSLGVCGNGAAAGCVSHRLTEPAARGSHWINFTALSLTGGVYCAQSLRCFISLLVSLSLQI